MTSARASPDLTESCSAGLQPESQGGYLGERIRGGMQVPPAGSFALVVLLQMPLETVPGSEKTSESLNLLGEHVHADRTG